MKVDCETRKWIAGPVDEYAAEVEGCKIDLSRVDHFFRALTDNVNMWEGRWAGQPYEPLSWHYECLAPIFGWVRFSEAAGRWVRRFRIASIWIGKKNGKSPTGALVGLYLLRYDGEQGQQVYSAAKDGKQAMIVQRNAINFIKSSPNLQRDLKIHKTTGRIDYADTNSFWEPLSALNVRSQEGKNGSIVIDECHVVGRNLGRAIADMGASREEPLRFEISTGGEENDQYGHDQYAYGKQVQDGRIMDTEFFFKSYEPPEGTTDGELCRFHRGKPTKAAVKLWRMANPSLGETITEEDFAKSLFRARNAGEAQWRAFKARRLTIWQTGRSNWLGRIWPREISETSADDMIGAGGSVALDLARVRDMTAAVFCNVAQTGKPTFFAHFWLPEARFRELSFDLVPQLVDWRNRGFITVTLPKVTDFDRVAEDVARYVETFDSQLLVFDPLFAEDVTFDIAEKTGIMRAEFKQTLEQYTAPTTDFERELTDGNLDFVHNPILDWQAGHVKLLERSAKKKPIKPEDGADVHKTVDGVQAAVMAFHGFQSLMDYGDSDDGYDII